MPVSNDGVNAGSSDRGQREIVDLTTSPVEARVAASDEDEDVAPLLERLRRKRAVESIVVNGSRPSASRETGETREEETRDDALVGWLRSDVAAHEDALLMRSLDVDDALIKARKFGIKISRDDFIRWLEREGVAFSQTKKRAEARARARSRAG